MKVIMEIWHNTQKACLYKYPTYEEWFDHHQYLLLNLRWWYNHLKNIVRWIIMKAAYWTAFGAMAIPLGVAILALVIYLNNDFYSFGVWIAIAFIVVGFASFIVGWGYTIREEHRNIAKDKEEREQRQIEIKERRKEHRLYLIALSYISQGRKVSISQLDGILRKWVNKEQWDKKWAENNKELVEELQILQKGLREELKD